ncbi:MAG: modification methylase TthHB8I [Fimbriimonadales bacterium]|nr:MAG: modification methylase TthHB8I [Fimbriimonadales bacterium]
MKPVGNAEQPQQALHRARSMLADAPAPLVLCEATDRPERAETVPLLLSERERHRALGFVETPSELVAFMVALAEPSRRQASVLEPACGDARFLTAFMRQYGANHALVGVEINEQTVPHTTQQLPPTVRIVHDDFLLWKTQTRFDIVIGNPPYGIVGDASHYPIHLLKQRKAEYKRRTTTWRGKYNLYGAFIEKSVRLLAPHGVLVFVVPTTWLVLDDFMLLRRFLAERGSVEVFYVGRVFPKVNVSAVVLRFTLGDRGLRLYDASDGKWRNPKALAPKVVKPDWDGGIVRFETDETVAFERSGTPLGELFRIQFAARSPEFRKSGLVRESPENGEAPVLTGRNLSAGRIDYETCYSGWWMRREDAANLRAFYSVPHLVVGHTKGARLVCAVDWRCYPWREEYHLTPREGVRVDWKSLEAYLNSGAVQHYLGALYRDFTPHLTKTMLSNLPLPFAQGGVS